MPILPPPPEADLVLVPHTHWDREWYEPHEVFRLRLVHVLDEVLQRLENDREFRFTLDGQAAAITDYLQIRPEARDRVRALVQRGQLAIGPFHILLDEFCCDGETIVRNLELGLATSARLGGGMPVGYLPDMFGHAAQMPQILRGFGIEHAALWRGVPARVTEHGFQWVAPDGSAVRSEYLFDGYGSALDLLAPGGPGQGERLGELTRAYRERTRSWYGAHPVLGMLGTDHSAPDPDLMDRLRRHHTPGDRTGSAGGPAIAAATLGEYLSSLPADEPPGRLPEVTGELRSHARGNLLPGVLSIRTNLKAAMARAELSLTQAERLDALYGAPGAHRAFFDLAWSRVVECTAHDSITGCGVDETAEQVAARLASAAQIGRAVTERVVAGLAAQVPSDAVLVANTLPWDRVLQAEVTLPGDAEPGHAQLLDDEGTGAPVVLGEETLASADLVRILRRIHGRELFGSLITSYSWGEDSLELRVAAVAEGPFDLAALTAEIEQRSVQQGRTWAVRTLAEPRRRALVAVDVPALGHVAVRLAAAGPPVGTAVTATRDRLDNDLVGVEVAADGSLTLTGTDGTTLAGVARLVDVGDRGDSYNFGPLAGDDGVSVPTSVRAELLESGPMRAVVQVDRAYDLPRGLVAGDPDRRVDKTEELRTRMLVEVRAGEPFVRITVSLVNTVRDHRLRLHVPLGQAVDRSWSAGQFAVTERGRSAEGGWGEFPIPTFPATGFVSAGDAHVLLDKLTEYEVVTPGEAAAAGGPLGGTDGSSGGAQQGDELALTLLRAVGMMSVNVHPLRDEPAGSAIPVPGAQYLGTEVTTRLAVLPHPGGWERAGAARWAEVFRHEPVVTPGTAPAGGELPAPVRGPELTGQAVLTSLRTVPAEADGHGDPVPDQREQVSADLPDHPVGDPAQPSAADSSTLLEARLVSVATEPAQVSLRHTDGEPAQVSLRHTGGSSWQPTDLRGQPVGEEWPDGTGWLPPWTIQTLRRPSVGRA